MGGFALCVTNSEEHKTSMYLFENMLKTLSANLIYHRDLIAIAKNHVRAMLKRLDNVRKLVKVNFDVTRKSGTREIGVSFYYSAVTDGWIFL